MESMIFWVVYFSMFLFTFLVSLIGSIRRTGIGGSREFDDLFIVGLLCALTALIWPLSIFGLIAVPIAKFYIRKDRREKEIQEELSKG